MLLITLQVIAWTTCQGSRDIRDAVNASGKSITEAIDRQTTRCRPYTPLFP